MTSFEGFFAGGLVGLAGGLEGDPLGGQGVFILDLDGLGFAGGEFVVREGEAGGFELEAGEDQDRQSSRASAREASERESSVRRLVSRVNQIDARQGG